MLKVINCLSFAKNVSTIIGKNISKNVSSKYSQKVLDHAKQCATDALKTASKRVIQTKQMQRVIWLAIKLWFLIGNKLLKIWDFIV